MDTNKPSISPIYVPFVEWDFGSRPFQDVPVEWLDFPSPV
jgi:hypothetical protein